MEKLKILLVMCISVASISAIGYGIWNAGIFIIATFKALNPTVAAGIIAASSTICVTTISVVIAKLLEQKMLISKELREKKTAVYDEFLKFVYGFFNGEIDLSTQEITEDVQKKFLEFARLITIWGSDEFVIEYSKFRTIGNSGDGRQIAIQMASLFTTIRKDLGHKNKKIEPHHIFSLFIRDANEVFQ